MNIINLTNDESGNFKISHFPDGQTDIVIYPEKLDFLDRRCQITSHFNSFEDLALIICATKALRKLKYKEIHLYIPYILGARSDRKFQKGGTSYLVDVVAPILNALNFESVTCVDAHSDVAQACINNLEVIDNSNLVKWSLKQIYGTDKGNFTITSPDQGSLKKIWNVMSKIGHTQEPLICSKHRDLTSGKILSTIVPLETCIDKMDYIIIDDICDGGRTFIEIAKVIKDKYANAPGEIKPTCRIFLIVTHGIFSNHFSSLNHVVDGIYTTDSITSYGYNVPMFDRGVEKVHQMPIMNNAVETILV